MVDKKMNVSTDLLHSLVLILSGVVFRSFILFSEPTNKTSGLKGLSDIIGLPFMLVFNKLTSLGNLSLCKDPGAKIRYFV
jgi:hypothetical protein